MRKNSMVINIPITMLIHESTAPVVVMLPRQPRCRAPDAMITPMIPKISDIKGIPVNRKNRPMIPNVKDAAECPLPVLTEDTGSFVFSIFITPVNAFVFIYRINNTQHHYVNSITFIIFCK